MGGRVFRLDPLTWLEDTYPVFCVVSRGVENRAKANISAT